MFEEIYHEYLLHQNDLNRKERYEGNEDWYHASGAGLCSRKLYFESVEKAKPTNPANKKSMRIMGLGTVMHKEIQSSLLYYNSINKEYNNKEFINIKEKKEILTYKKKNLEFKIEGEIKVRDLNVRGFFDVLLLDTAGSKSEPLVKLLDIKTIGTWQWSQRFSKLNLLRAGIIIFSLELMGWQLRNNMVTWMV